MSSTSGTASTKSEKKKSTTNRLSASDICSIIQACNSSLVEEIRFEGLHIKFQSLGQGVAGQVSQPVDHLEVVSQTKDEISTNDGAIEEAEDGMLMVSDPVEHERLQVSRHIERLRNEKAYAQ